MERKESGYVRKVKTKRKRESDVCPLAEIRTEVRIKKREREREVVKQGIYTQTDKHAKKRRRI